MRRLARSWFERSAPVVAADLLGKLFVSTADGVRVSGRIVETEAYTEDDPASHTFRGPTPRNRVMFGPPGHLYVYLSYGLHRCANVVVGPVGRGEAVLLRAVEPVEGVEAMQARRGPVRAVALADGPGKFGQAFGIGLSDDGADLVAGETFAVFDDGTEPPAQPLVGPRIGLTKAVETPWRFRVPPAPSASSGPGGRKYRRRA